jgi:DNA-directed RNA polymerase specialized sigma24 family protein
MSATVIALLCASAETPAIPPGVISERAFGDRGESRIPETDDLLETGQTDPAELIAAEPVQESPAGAADAAIALGTQVPGGDPDLWLYRDRTIAMLRRYMRLALEVGRMPSLLGREFFRSRITSYKASTFEDTVIFVHDVERSLEKLGEFEKQLIAKVVLQEYSQEEAGRQLGCGLRHAARCYAEALDRMTEIFLKRELLTRLPRSNSNPEKSCQGGKTDEFLVSDSEQAKNKS